MSALDQKQLLSYDLSDKLGSSGFTGGTIFSSQGQESMIFLSTVNYASCVGGPENCFSGQNGSYTLKATISAASKAISKIEYKKIEPVTYANQPGTSYSFNHIIDCQ